MGILLYEMLCGVTPFRQKDKAKLRRMITCDKLKFTKNADGALQCFTVLPSWTSHIAARSGHHIPSVTMHR